MSIRPAPGRAHPAYPRDSVDPAAIRLAHEEPAAFQHEHGRLYDALETAAQIAELAGHDILAAALRRDRADIASEISRDACDQEARTPPDTRRTTTGLTSSHGGGPDGR